MGSWETTLVALLLLLTATALAAQPADTAPNDVMTAVLVIGPEERRGIDALAPDVTPHWYGRYRVGGAMIDIRYVRAPLEKPDAWTPAPCPERFLRASGDGMFYHPADQGWSLLVGPVSGELSPGVTICTFVDRFVARHLLFTNLEGVRVPGAAPVFPAVIEL